MSASEATIDVGANDGGQDSQAWLLIALSWFLVLRSHGPSMLRVRLPAERYTLYAANCEAWVRPQAMEESVESCRILAIL